MKRFESKERSDKVRKGSHTQHCECHHEDTLYWIPLSSAREGSEELQTLLIKMINSRLEAEWRPLWDSICETLQLYIWKVCSISRPSSLSLSSITGREKSKYLSFYYNVISQYISKYKREGENKLEDYQKIFMEMERIQQAQSFDKIVYLTCLIC